MRCYPQIGNPAPIEGDIVLDSIILIVGATRVVSLAYNKIHIHGRVSETSLSIRSVNMYNKAIKLFFNYEALPMHDIYGNHDIVLIEKCIWIYVVDIWHHLRFIKCVAEFSDCRV